MNTLTVDATDKIEVEFVELPPAEKSRRRLKRRLFACAVAGLVFSLVLAPLIFLYWDWGGSSAPAQTAGTGSGSAPAPPPLADAPAPPPQSPPEDRVRFYEVRRGADGGFDEHTRTMLPTHDLMLGLHENTVLGRTRDHLHSAALWDLYFMTHLKIVTFMKLNVCFKPPIELLKDVTIFWPTYFSLWDARSVYLELYRPDACVPPDYAWDSANVSLEEVWPVVYASEHAQNGIRFGQPTLQFQCRTGRNACDAAGEGFLQWETASAVHEAFYNIQPQDYVDNFMAKALEELEYEPFESVSLDFHVVSDAGRDERGRPLVRLCGWQRVFKTVHVHLEVNGTHSQAERAAEDAIDAYLQTFHFRQRLFPLVSLYDHQIRADAGHMWSHYGGLLSRTSFRRVRYVARRVATHAGVGPLPIRFLTTVFVREDDPAAGNVTIPTVTGNLQLSEGAVAFFVDMIKADGSLRGFINATVTNGYYGGLDCAASHNDEPPYLDVRCRAVVREA